MQINEILKHAERGVLQAPTLPGCRYPALKGWRDLVTTDPAVIRERSARGYSWVSVAREGGVCIIDIDDAAAAASLGLPAPADTLVVRTPSGGRHVYYRHTDESATLGNINVLTPDGRPAVEFKANNLTCASPGVFRLDKAPYGYYTPETDSDLAPLPDEMATFLRAHQQDRNLNGALREMHPDYDLEDEIAHYGWQLTGMERFSRDGARFIEFAVCPIDLQVHVGMDEPGNFKCCLTVGSHGLGFKCYAGRHQFLTIRDVWNACERRGIEPYSHARYS